MNNGSFQGVPSIFPDATGQTTFLQGSTGAQQTAGTQQDYSHLDCPPIMPGKNQNSPNKYLQDNRKKFANDATNQYNFQ